MTILQTLLQTGNYLTNMNFTLIEIIEILLFLGAIISPFIIIKIQVEKLRTSTTLQLASQQTENNLKLESLRSELDLKIKAIDSKTVGLADFLSVRLSEFVASNKDDHTGIKTSVDHITDLVNSLNVQIAGMSKSTLT